MSSLPAGLPTASVPDADAGHIAQATAPSAGHGDVTEAPLRHGAWRWLKQSMGAEPARPAQHGLTAKQAAAALKKAGALPRIAQGSAHAHVKALLQGVPGPERADMVEAVRLLLPPKISATVYDATVTWLSGLAPQARVPLALAAAPLVTTLRLRSESDAVAYTQLLETIRNVPESQSRILVRCCRGMQPSWDADVSADLWRRALVILAPVSVSDMPAVTRAVLSNFARLKPFDVSSMPASQASSEAFLACVAAYVQQDAGGRADMLDNIRRTFSAGYTSHTHREAGHIETVAALATRSPQARAEIARNCDAIFAVPRIEREGERTCVAKALLRPEAGHMSLTYDLLHDLRAAGLPIIPWLTREINLPIAQLLHDPTQRREILALLRATFSGAGAPVPDWAALRALLQVPEAERAEAVLLLRALASRGLLAYSVVDTQVVRATPEERRAHLARLAPAGPGERGPAAREGGAGDLENVMQGDLRRQVDAAIEALKQRFFRPGSTKGALREMEQWLQGLRDRMQTHPDAIVLRRRGGDTEINNALRTLNGAKRPGDFSGSVQQTPDMAALCALVWHAIAAPRPGVSSAHAAREQELMRHGLMMALARCIEDDGHRVCGVGQRQYVVDVLKGYYREAGDAQQSVTPRSLVTVLTADFYASHGDETPPLEQVEAFKQRALAVAKERFTDPSPLAEFVRDFEAYMHMTY